MLKNVSDITNQDFSGGLNTISDIFNIQKNQSPDMMDVKVNFDGSMEKRLGNTSMNSIAIGGASLAMFNSGPQTITNNLVSYWNMNEETGNRNDTYSNHNLTLSGSASFGSGKKSNALVMTGSGSLTNSELSVFRGISDFSVSSWIYLNTLGHVQTIASKRGLATDANVTLLLHCDGTDASTTFTDNSISSHVTTANGNAQIDTAQSKFGGASGLFDGTGDYLSVPNSDDWDFGTGDFTVDMWLRFNDITQSFTIANKENGVNGWAITFNAVSGVLALYDFDQSAVTVTATAPNANQWYHF